MKTKAKPSHALERADPRIARSAPQALSKNPTRPSRAYKKRNPRSTFAPPLPRVRQFPPHPISPFVGREHELVELKRAFKRTRLLTLTGAGGSGKTRLALELATRHAAQFRDGVCWVELAPLADAALVPNAVAAALRVREKIGQSLTDVLVSFLQPRALLLVLDNCEHLIDACAELVHTLLSACGELKILVTSREAFGIAGESVYLVPALEMPGETWSPSLAAVGKKHFASALSRWSKFDAVRLFVERSREADATFALTAENVKSIAQICRRLDGMPLAIELAAARVRMLSPDEIAARLDDRFHLLTISNRTASPRHQTLQAAMDWSYALLSEEERALLRRLAVFAGGWTLDAAVHVTNLSALVDAAYETETLEHLSHLIDKSLIVRQARDSGTRYDMLETIRQFARDRLGEAGEKDAVATRHLDFYVMLAEEAGLEYSGRETPAWVKRLRLEHDNLRAAMGWALEKGAIEKGLRIGAALLWFWYDSGHITEANGWLERLLDASLPDVSGSVRAKAMLAAGVLARQLGDFDGALRWLNAALELYRAQDDQEGIAIALQELGFALHWQGDRGQAIALLEQGLALSRAADDKARIGDTLLRLGDAQMRQGNLDAAEAHFQEALQIRRELGDPDALAWALGGLGDVARLQGNWEEAARYFHESLKLHSEKDYWGDVAFILEALGILAVQMGQPVRAARLWGAGEHVRLTRDEPLAPSYEADYAPHIAAAREQLGAEKFAAEWERGRAFPLDKAIAYAVEQDDISPPIVKGMFEPLTAREMQVLQLIAEGNSNEAIAEKLVLARGTVKWYTTQLYGKLGVTSRTQAVARARELQLLPPKPDS